MTKKTHPACGTSKSVWGGTILRLSGIIFRSFLLLLFLTPFMAGPASAGGDNVSVALETGASDSTKQRMIYEVYAGGFNVLKAALDVKNIPSQRYALNLSAETKGFLGRVVPWRGFYETEGWERSDGMDQPEIHRSVSTFRGERDQKLYRYDENGSLAGYEVTEAGQDKSPDKVDPALTEGTVDVLTATLAVMKTVSEEGVCEGQSEVFDGKRRFSLIFQQEAETVLQSSGYNIFEGPALRCTVEVEPIAGKWHEKPRGWMSIQEQGRDKGALPTVWLGQLDPDGPAVPVKIRVKTKYGTLFMHLVDYIQE